MTSPVELWQLLAGKFAEHQIGMASYHLYDMTAGKVTVAAYGHPRPFQKDYVDKQYAKLDPIHQYALQNGAPFRWKDIRKLAEISSEQDAFLRLANEAGLFDGVGFGVYGPKMRHGFVGLGFGPDTPEPSEGLIWSFQLICQAGHIRCCELISDEGSVELTARERETLEWMASGKSNSEIAQIMDISPHTVDTNVRRIYSKLGVSDRTTATLKGLGAGVLHLSDVIT